MILDTKVKVLNVLIKIQFIKLFYKFIKNNEETKTMASGGTEFRSKMCINDISLEQRKTLFGI
jgi:hypothetical protein